MTKNQPAYTKSSGEAKKVFVGMSGGVDSSVSAALLKKAGYDVVGVFIKVWNPEWLPCTWKEERRDAMRVAAKLDIPFLTFDFEKEYKKEVVDYMLREYKEGKTPNPDVMCNKEIKFGSFLRKAREMGADYIATGHYAVTKNNELYEGNDKNKDQSYFLWTLTREQLQYVLFPIGHLQKKEVRMLAKKFKLPTAEKKDSQGICFLGPVDMKEFLGHYIPSKKGLVLNENRKEVGFHDGAVFYTIGERHGFTIIEKTSDDAPYYIVAKDIKANILTVSQKTFSKSEYLTKKVALEETNWIENRIPDPKKKKLGARFRYRQQKIDCTIHGNTVIFDKPQAAVSAGQSIVVYEGEKVYGGGIIVL